MGTKESDLFADVTALREIEIPGFNLTITCRNELSVGEQRDIFRRAFKGDVALPNGETRTDYDLLELSFGQVCAYVAEWSLKRELSRDAIRALKRETYNAIEDAVKKHVAALEAVKNAPAAATKNEKTRGAATTSISAVG